MILETEFDINELVYIGHREDVVLSVSTHAFRSSLDNVSECKDETMYLLQHNGKTKESDIISQLDYRDSLMEKVKEIDEYLKG